MADEALIYEQCPFDLKRVLAFYRNIPSIDESGEWHGIRVGSGLGFYRVFERRTFQVVLSASKSSLLSEVLLIEPPDTAEDAAWTIERDSEGCIAVSTVFTTTFGPFDGVSEVNQSLEPFGLSLMPRHRYLEGAALLPELTTELLDEAMMRLRWLEAACLAANRAVTAMLQDEWGKIRRICDVKAAQHPDSEEVLPLPPDLRPSGPKRREPL